MVVPDRAPYVEYSARYDIVLIVFVFQVVYFVCADVGTRITYIQGHGHPTHFRGRLNLAIFQELLLTGIPKWQFLPMCETFTMHALDLS